MKEIRVFPNRSLPPAAREAIGARQPFGRLEGYIGYGLLYARLKS